MSYNKVIVAAVLRWEWINLFKLHTFPDLRPDQGQRKTIAAVSGFASEFV